MIYIVENTVVGLIIVRSIMNLPHICLANFKDTSMELKFLYQPQIFHRISYVEHEINMGNANHSVIISYILRVLN